MKKDIESRKDIEELVKAFYEEVRKNELLGNIFDNIMHVDWEKHLPKMYNFWENIVLQTGNYKGFPFAAHLPVNEKERLTPKHFSIWLELFHNTIDKLFEGENAEQLKLKSSSIKEVWSYKMDYINNYTSD